MKKNISLSEFRRGFEVIDRDNFSREGYAVLYEFLEDEENFCAHDIDCSYVEYESVEEYNKDNGTDYEYPQECPVFFAMCGIENFIILN